MTVAGSIFLVVVGAVLYFASDSHLADVDLGAVSLILIVAGLLGIFLGLVQQAIWARRGRRTERPGEHDRLTEQEPPDSVP